jgi:hypothetical protein
MNHKYSQTKLWFIFEHLFDEEIYMKVWNLGQQNT